MPPTRRNFQYMPLKAFEFRIVEIMQASYHDPIDCLIRHTNLNDVPFYEPLSYAWGDSKSRETIHLAYKDTLVTAICHKIISLTTGTIEPNYQTSIGTLSISSNLAGALRQLRKEYAPRPIWVDAICINQEDMQERSEQIQKMWLIYSRAPLLVTIWLGELQDEAAKAANLNEGDMRSALSYIREIHDNYICKIDGDILKAWENLWDAESPMDPTLLRALSSLYRRPWFTRVWVLQEHIAARAARMVCGDITLGFRPFMRTMTVLMHVLELEDPSTLDALLVIGLHSTARRRLCDPGFSSLPIGKRVLEVLTIGARLNATDPRDRLYGLLGFLGDISGYPVLQPDYTKPLNKFWYDLTKFLILETNSLHFIQQPDPGASPSWVIRWEIPNCTIGKDLKDITPVISKRHSAVNISPDGNFVHTKVITLGQVSDHFSIHHSMQDDLEHWTSEMRSLEGRLEGTPAVLRQYKTEQNIKLALRDLVIRRMDDSRGRDPSELKERYMMLMGRLPLRSFSSQSKFLSDNDISKLHRKSLPHTLGFLILSSGYFGIFEQGDADAKLHNSGLSKICIFPGANSPFELAMKGDVHQLGRKCRISGIEDAYTEDMLRLPGNSEWEDICLA